MSRGFFENLDGKQGAVFGFLAGIVFMVLLSYVLGGGGFQLGSGKSSANLASNQGTTSPTPSQPQAQPTAQPTAQPSGQLRPVDESDWIRGNQNAQITLIEYSDFECPFCLRHKPTIDQILSEYPNDVRFVYRHFPLRSIHPQAQKAAEASECAGAQGKFWEMHDALFDAAAANNLSVASFKQLAGGLGLNQSQFDSCLDSNQMANKVQQHLTEGQAAGVTGTPGTFVNGQLVRGAVPYSTFQSIVESQL